MHTDNENALNIMVRLRLGFLTLLILFYAMTAVSCNSSSGEENKNDSLNKFTVQLNQRIINLMEVYDIPGVNIALVQKGKMVWVKAFGYADLENKRKMTTDTYCRVESISKSVTAWGVMKLAEQGDLELDTPIVHYLKTWSFPESNFQTSAITIRQLLSQTSGMPLGTIGVRYSPYENRPSLKEVLTRDAVLGREPGQSFSYSNTGFNLLELLIEEVTGRDFAEYMQLEILNPLGMEHSSFNWSESFEPPVPFGYDARNSPVPVYVYPDKAAGGLFSTVEDIATFISAGMTGFSSSGLNVLKAQNINQLYTPEAEIPGFYGIVFDSYGMGHFIEGLPNGEKAVSHGGQGSGWMTHFHSIPETGDGIVILTNSQRSWPFFAHILSDWARWNSFPSVGMGKIILGTKILWAFIGALFLWSLWQIWRLAKGLVSGTRNFSPMSKRHRGLWWGQIIVSIGIIAILVWSINQPYLFVSSVFPIAANWLGGSLLLVALVLMWSACFPIRNSSRHKQVIFKDIGSMKKLKLIFEYFLLVIFSLVLCFQLKAQNPKFSQKTDTLSSVSYKTKYTPIPFAAYSPDTRLMFGGFLLRQFKPTHAGEETRPSNIQLTATYTLNQQINLSSSYTVLYPNERWMWKGEIGFKKFPKSYWGVGPSTLEEDELKVNYQMIKLKQTILKRIAENTYLGPQLRFSHMYKVSFKDLNDQPIAPPDVTGTEGSTNVGLGIVFNWDKRDNILTPTQNHYLELSTLFYSSLFQSEYGFQSYKIDARKYFSLKESGKEVLAFQALMLFTSGDVPFEEMGMVGGEIIMRGYFEGRYRDKNSIQAQMEYRRLISGRFAAVAFGAVGNVMPRLRDLKTDSTKWTLGAGLRYNINKADPTYIRVDYGFGKETSGLYITFGEAF